MSPNNQKPERPNDIDPRRLYALGIVLVLALIAVGLLAAFG